MDGFSPARTSQVFFADALSMRSMPFRCSWSSNPPNTAYGVGFDPLGLKWNFERHGRISPYLELTGGTVFTNHDVPTGTNTVNFMDQAALGIHILGAKHNVSLELRYMHISNAGLATPNPGVNTVQVRLGIGKFSPAESAENSLSAPLCPLW